MNIKNVNTINQKLVNKHLSNKPVVKQQKPSKAFLALRAKENELWNLSTLNLSGNKKVFFKKNRNIQYRKALGILEDIKLKFHRNYKWTFIKYNWSESIDWAICNICTDIDEDINFGYFKNLAKTDKKVALHWAMH